MLGRAEIVNAISKRVAARPSFTMQHLWRQALWGSSAAAALLVAVLTSLSDVGSQRAAMMLSSLNATSSRLGQTNSQAPSQVASRPLDADAARQLAQTVRGLAEDRDRIMTRLTAVEHNIDEMTGSITRQIEEAKAATAQAVPPPWPTDAPPILMTPASIESVAAPIEPSPGESASPLPATPLAPAAEQPSPESAASASPPAYGADIGSASSMKALHARWAGIHSAHAQIFEGLQPVVTLRDDPRSNRIELRLVVGPLPNAERAAQLCASLAAFRLSCEPTMFNSRHLALQ